MNTQSDSDSTKREHVDTWCVGCSYFVKREYVFMLQYTRFSLFPISLCVFGKANMTVMFGCWRQLLNKLLVWSASGKAVAAEFSE